jgi:hypothetical protein
MRPRVSRWARCGRGSRCEALGLPRGIVITGLDKENVSFEETLRASRKSGAASAYRWNCPRMTGMRSLISWRTRFPTSSARGRAGEERPGGGRGGGERRAARKVSQRRAPDARRTDRPACAWRVQARSSGAGLRGRAAAGHRHRAVAGGNGATCSRRRWTHRVTDADGQADGTAPEAPLVAQVWRSVNDPYVGQMSVPAHLGGTLKADSEIFNATKGQKERIGFVHVVNGKKRRASGGPRGRRRGAGQAEVHRTNDTICQRGQSLTRRRSSSRIP